MTGVALVTGSSRGIGRAIALRLAKDGFDVAINDLATQKNDLEELRAEIVKLGRVSLIFPANVSVEEEVETMISAVVEQMGDLDVMVANAGICITKPFFETTAEDFHRLFAVNVDGVFFCYKHAGLQMIKQGKGGRIIGASSLAGKKATRLLGAYSTSKFAVRGLTQAAGQSTELAPHRITVNAYAPGAVDTDMLQDLRQTARKINGEKEPTPSEPRKSMIPLGRDLRADEIAGLVSYLVSEDAAMITGQSVSINGGLSFE
ncbi:acetoin reductase family protein [Gymnopilus junonius]|uniref:Acetoin reductase family protein n=1 Tax=Gymnopilus junonius TaxID=109634 RepID=A0A9P5NZA8_GYMJU|nr:acetoin reductase family protein [Gymnopilus junonius]